MDSPPDTYGAYIDQSDSTHTFFNDSPDKVNKGWFHPPYSLGFVLFDNLLRFRINHKHLRYIRHFGDVPTNKEPPDKIKRLK
ncbi:hypothetical protein Hanom_Chr17g01573251 [Helianthus anomalus]